MAFFNWQANYAFDIVSIDNDHKQLVGLINELHEALSQGKGKTIINEVVTSLISYTKSHFSREEMYMRSISYKDFEAHKFAHDAFVEQVADFQQRLIDGKDNFSVEIMVFLRDWLSSHILQVDKMLAPHLKKYGIT